jgi:hypothetical protein
VWLVKSSDVRAIAVTSATRGPEALASHIQFETTKWAKVAKESGAKPD